MKEGIVFIWVGVSVLGIVFAKILLGLPPSIFLLATGLALCGLIFLIWTSLSHLGGEAAMSYEEALSLAAPTAAEEQKRAVLRALKDLEYELKVGKISQEDYNDASDHYRKEARKLIARADESIGPERRQAAEAAVSTYLAEKPEEEES